MVATVNSTGTSTGVVITPDSSGVLALQTGGTTAITIDTSQNVGIGTASPAYKLDVNGTANLRSTDTAVYVRWDNSKLLTMQTNESGAIAAEGMKFTVNGRTQYGVINSYGGALRLVAADAGSNASTVFSRYDGTTSTESMRIDSSGNLLVGTTSTPSSSNPGVRISNPATATPIFAYNGTSTVPMINFVNGNGTVGHIDTSGSNTSYVTSSDYRLKENIAPMTGALAKVAQLKPSTYKWKADGSDGEGFIAHELAEVCPHAVSGEKDAVDAEGNPQYQGIDTSFLVATLTAAIQELKAINDTQAATINALTARIVALEGA